MMASNMNTTNHDGGLQATAQENIDALYEAIYRNPEILDDSKPLAETPLHIFASAGEVQLATEIMRLKPSLAWKLNRQGQSPIHLAMQQEKYEMVIRFIEINKKLVRVKGKGGFTPLHIASQTGKVDLLANFLEACPDSIEDVTGRSETALHIAAIHDQFEALKVLVGWLKRNGLRRAAKLVKTILNWKDETGNTILHILTSKNNPEMIQFVIKSGMDFNAMNLDNKTALDLVVARCNAQNGENTQREHDISSVRGKLIKAGAKHGDDQVIKRVTTLETKLRMPITVTDRIMIRISRMKSNITEDQRNVFFIVVTLIATSSYQTVLSPPGGLYQANANEIDNSNADNITSLNSTAVHSLGVAGTTIMDYYDFVALFTWNAMTLLVSTMILVILTPHVDVYLSLLLFTPTGWLVMSYIFSLQVISPPILGTPEFFDFMSPYFLMVPFVSYWLVRVKRKFWNRYAKKREIPLRIDAAENIW